MKIKITTLFLTGLFLCLQTIKADDLFSHLDKETEKKYWDFMSERLFDPDSRVFATFPNTNINFVLVNATKQDSLIVMNLMDQLQELIPNRRFQFLLGDTNGYLKNWPDLYLYFSQRDTLNNPPFETANESFLSFKDNNGNMLEYIGYAPSPPTVIFTQRNFLFFNDSTSYSLRKQYIEFTILRSMCYFNNKGPWATSIKNAIFNDEKFIPTNTEFREVDKFLIHKLYSENLEKKHRNFVISNHGWKTYYKPYIQKITEKITFKVIAILLGVFLLIFSYKRIFLLKFRKPFLEYLVPGLVMAVILSLVLLCYNFQDILSLRDSARPWTRIAFDIVVPFSMLIGSFGAIASLLYVIEKLFLLTRVNITKQLIFKFFTLPLILLLISAIVFIASGFKLEMFSFSTHILTIGIPIAILRGIFLYLKNITELQIREKEVEISRLREQKAKAEIQSLHSRINPHFLYNSLNSIAGLAYNDPEKTEKMALSLSDLFRYTINRKGKQISSIEEEIEMVKTYLDIEKIRFGARMSYTINIEEDLEQAQVPMYIIQPLVENAVKHGISKISGKGEVSLSVTKSGKEIIIEVADNGPDFEEGLVSGYGLQSVHDILQLTYGKKAGIVWQNEPNKSIRVNIPIN